MDRKFEPLRDKLKANETTQNAILNTTGTNEHVPEIEQRIRVMKEHMQAERANLPYTMLPIVMIVDLLSHIVMRLNNFPLSAGHQNYSPHGR